MAVVDDRFRVMASDAQVILVDPSPGSATAARERLATLEQRWSRFLPGSDISRLARANGEWLVVSPDTWTLLETMVSAYELTAGRFDPTMLHEIVSTGYATSVDDGSRVSVTVDLPHPDATVADIATDVMADTHAHLAKLPEGMGIDPGGIGKGLAADLVCADMIEAGVTGALVNIGGDLAASGTAPDPQGWIVTVEDPFDATSVLLRFAMNAGGVATSSTRSRRWSEGGHRRHHVLDPRTRDTASTDLVAATVVAPSAWMAEVHAKAALLEGSARALHYLDRHGLSGVCSATDGTHLATPDLTALVAPADDAAPWSTGDVVVGGPS